MKKRNLALIFFFLIFLSEGTIFVRNSNGYVYQLLEFNTGKSVYLINETLSIHTKWNYFTDENEEAFLRYEICTNEGTLLNQSQSYDENGFGIEHSYLINIINLNLPPQQVPTTLVINLHFFLYDIYSGERFESYDSQQVQVIFFNLSYSYRFMNYTNLCFSDSLQLSLTFWERDFDHSNVCNLNLSCQTVDGHNQSVLESNLFTNYEGMANLSISTKDLQPGNYSMVIRSNSSKIFNYLEIIQNFFLFPKKLTVFISPNPQNVLVSIPEANIFSNNSLYVYVWYNDGCFSFPELELTWTLLNDKGILYDLGNLTFFGDLIPMTKLGEFDLEIKGSSRFFNEFRLSTKVTVTKRPLSSRIVYDNQRQILTLTMFDQETNKILPLSLLGAIKIKEINQFETSKRLTYEIQNNTIVFSPSFQSDNFEEYQIEIDIQESEYFYSYSKIVFPRDFLPNVSNNASDPVIFIAFSAIFPGIFIFLYFSRNKKKKGFLLKHLKFEI